MFTKLTGIIKKYFTRHMIVRHPAYVAANKILDHTLSDKDSVLNQHLSSESNHSLRGQIASAVERVITNNNSILAVREMLVEAAISFAAMQVLIMNKNGDDPTTLRSAPGVTGELAEHLYEIYERDAVVNKLVSEKDIDKPSVSDIRLCILASVN